MWYTDASYAGCATGTTGSPATATQCPAEGCIPQGFAGAGQTAQGGVLGIPLPDTFFPVIEDIAQSEIEGNDIRATYQLTHASVKVQPSGYSDAAAGAVNVVSGNILVGTYLGGDNRAFNPAGAYSRAPGVVGSDDTAEWITNLPDQLQVMKWTKCACSEWKKGTELKAFAVPNTSTALAPWPPYTQDFAGGAAQNVVSNTTHTPQIIVVMFGAQPDQVMTIEFNLRFKCFGIETYEMSSGQNSRRHPIDATAYVDLLQRTIPEHSAPALVKVGAPETAHVRAYMQHLQDTGVPKPLEAAKAVAKEADNNFGSSIAGVLMDVGVGLLGALL